MRPDVEIPIHRVVQQWAHRERSGGLSTVQIHDLSARVFFESAKSHVFRKFLQCCQSPELTQSEIQEQRQRLKMHGWAKAGNTWFGPEAEKAWLGKS